MYKIYADDTLIYDSTIDDYKLGKGEITLETNKAGSFVFSLYPDHFYYDRFVRLTTIITVYKRDKILFRGRILNDVTDHWNNKVLTCEGELSFLQDSVIRPFSFTGTPTAFFKKCIDEHNAQVDSFKKFKIGNVTVSDSNNSITRSSGLYDSTISSLTSRTIESDLGGYLYITHGEDGRDPIPTIHWVADFDKHSTQTIEFGVNLKNYTKTVKAEDIATAIIPLGADLEGETESGESKKLTIESVNNGKDYLYSPEAVAVYGWIFKTVEFSDITVAKNLKTKAEAYLKSVILHPTTIELDAIDLNLLNPDIESIGVNEYVRGKSEPHNFDITLLCSKQTINILKADGDSYTLGYTYRSFASANSKLSNAVTQIKNNYATKTSVAEKITQTKSEMSVESDRILTIVETTYGTKDALATGLASVRSQITQTSSSIISTVEATYAKTTDVNSGLASVRSEIAQSADSIISTVEANYAKATDVKSEISQKADSILLTVAGTYATTDYVNGALALKIKSDGSGKRYSELSADVDKIVFNSGEIEINTDTFSLVANGDGCTIGGWTVNNQMLVQGGAGMFSKNYVTEDNSAIRFFAGITSSTTERKILNIEGSMTALGYFSQTRQLDYFLAQDFQYDILSIQYSTDNGATWGSATLNDFSYVNIGKTTPTAFTINAYSPNLARARMKFQISYATASPKFAVTDDGSLILMSSGNKKYKVSVSDSGSLITSAIS